MKSMSQVLPISDCPETLEEARRIIADQQSSLMRLREELKNATRPAHWFRATSEGRLLTKEPEEIEFLNCWTGETFIHVGGTAYWNREPRGGLDVLAMNAAGITHWRVRK